MRIPRRPWTVAGLWNVRGVRKVRGVSRVRKVSRVRTVLVLAVALAVVVATFAVWPRILETHVTVMFSRAVGLYPGSEVRVLGVPIGTVTAVTPMGDHVAVELEYDSAIKVPASASAAGASEKSNPPLISSDLA